VGGFLLPPAVYVTFLISSCMDNKFMYVLPMLIVGISDPMAGILGMNIKQNNKYITIFGHTLQKTRYGSLVFLISSFLIAFTGLYLYMGVFLWKTLWLALLISVVTTLTEMFSKRGWDNLLIPVATNIILILFLT
jgi:dolichol kinase